MDLHTDGVAAMTTIYCCPFCGHEDVEIDEIGMSEYAVDCPECRAIGPIRDTVMEAIGAWNDRRGINNQQINEANNSLDDLFATLEDLTLESQK